MHAETPANAFVDPATLEAIEKAINELEKAGPVTVSDIARTLAISTGKSVDECAAAIKRVITEFHVNEAAEQRAQIDAIKFFGTNANANDEDVNNASIGNVKPVDPEAVAGLEQALGVPAGTFTPINANPVAMPVGYQNRKARRAAKKRAGGFRRR